MRKPILAALLGTLQATSALAGVNVQGFDPAMNSTYMFTEDALLQVAPQDSTWTGRRLFFSASTSWVNDPLVEMSADRKTQEGVIVDGINTLHLGAAWFVNQRLSVNLGVPLNLVHLPGQANQFGIGESHLMLKHRMTSDDSILAVSIIPEAILPTGASDLFLSSGQIGGGVRFAFERDFGSIRAAANVGFRYSPGAVFRDLDYTRKLPMSLGLYAPLGGGWGVNAEANGAIVLPLNRFSNPGGLYLGARYEINRTAAVTFGGTVGSVAGNGASDVAVIAGLRFSPMSDPAPAAVPVVAPVAVVAPPALPRVVFTPKEIRITEEVKFQHAKAVLTTSGKDLLDEVAEVIKENRKQIKKITVEGHTNTLGSQAYNMILSDQRAMAVKEYLISRGVPAKILGSVGFGKTRPKHLPGLPREVQLEANRRVEFKVQN